MASIKLEHGATACWLLYYHLVLVVKYRRKVITDDISERMAGLFASVAKHYGAELDTWNHERDHVHVMFKAKPSTDIVRLINSAKSCTSRIIRKEHPELEQVLWSGHFWSESYCLITTGGAPVEVIRQYIENQGKKDEAEKSAAGKA